MPDASPVPAPLVLGRPHARRLREIYRSAGWPCQDGIELELLAAGMLERVCQASGHETLRLTEAGIAQVAAQMAVNRAAFSAHERLVQQVARQMVRAGRIVWCGLGLRAQVPAAEGAEGAAAQWVMARPDVFSIRNSTRAEYLEPVVHEIKVRRADLLGDLRKPAKRAAYQHLGECWYVLGEDARGRPVGDPDEIPDGCGVLVAQGERLVVARAAPRQARNGLPLALWMALAKATPVQYQDEREAQGLLVDEDPAAGDNAP